MYVMFVIDNRATFFYYFDLGKLFSIKLLATLLTLAENPLFGTEKSDSILKNNLELRET